MNILITVLDTLGCNIHRNVQRLEDTDAHYILTESDGTKNYLNKERYLLTIVK